MAIYDVTESEGKPAFVISSNEVWLPGSYESRKAANYAFRFSCGVLQKLQDSVNPGGTITFQMLQDEAKK